MAEMRLYRQSDSGEAVRDIQQRLRRLGMPTDPDPAGEYLVATEAAVCAFQNRRGLPADGIVGPDTWRELVEAGRRFGDRLLYYRKPMLRGDDVLEMQQRLSILGFDTGKVDGIFGPDTQQALIEFQQNRHLAEDGMAGPVVARELQLVGRAMGHAGRELVREREWLRNRPIAIAGLRIFLDPFCRTESEAEAGWEAATSAARALRDVGAAPIMSRASDVRPLERIRARRANRLGADLVIGFAHPEADDTGVSHFGSDLSHSEVGRDLAISIGQVIDLPVHGRATPLLRETRSPAVVIATLLLDSAIGKETAGGIQVFLTREPDRLDT